MSGEEGRIWKEMGEEKPQSEYINKSKERQTKEFLRFYLLQLFKKIVNTVLVVSKLFLWHLIETVINTNIFPYILDINFIHKLQNGCSTDTTYS